MRNLTVICKKNVGASRFDDDIIREFTKRLTVESNYITNRKFSKFVIQTLRVFRTSRIIIA